MVSKKSRPVAARISFLTCDCIRSERVYDSWNKLHSFAGCLTRARKEISAWSLTGLERFARLSYTSKRCENCEDLIRWSKVLMLRHK